MKTKIEELKAAYEAATPGEWKVDHWNHDGSGQNGGTIYVGDTVDPEGFIAFEHVVLEADCDNYVKSVAPDMDFIALAHNLMPTLLEAVELLETVSSARACQDHEFDVDAWFKQVRSLLGDLK